MKDRSSARALRVLVVDDEPLVARALRRVLCEHDVVIADGGERAIALLTAEGRFDVVLCDLMMPDVSGMDVYERLADTHPETVVRFVFMTGGPFTARARAFLDGVPNERLEKPFDVSRVRTLIQSMGAQ